MKKRILTAALLLMVLLAGCGAKTVSPNAGLWTAHSVSVWGAEQPAENVFSGGFTIDLISGGRAKITMSGVTADAIWTLKDGLFTIRGGGLDAAGTLEGSKMVLQDVVGTGSSVSLYKEGAALPPIAPPPAAPAQAPAEATDSANAEPVKGFAPPSYWKGVINNENIKGDFRFPERIDVRGIINIDRATSRPYFEIWMEKDSEEETLLSLFIDLRPDGFDADIGEEDAWLYYRDLEPYENDLFSGSLQDGEMVFFYHYIEEDGTTADVEIRLQPE